MMTPADTPADLQDIYRQTVLNHSRNPLNQGRLEDANREATGFNPLCGDKITVYFKVDDDRIDSAAFEGTGCAICLSSASMMTAALNKHSLPEADDMIRQVGNMLDHGADLTDPDLQELQALAGVRNYPSRIKCATLAWKTAAAALHGNNSHISTESQGN